MLTLLLGTDWVANRSALFDMVVQDVNCKKAGRIIMVPELISHDTERVLCAQAGDTASRYAEVLSFTRLARRVADSIGHAAVSCLDNGGRVVAMAAAARQLHSKLKAYAAVETKPEFLTGLIDAIDEFKRCCITAADLKAASEKAEGSLAQKLEELALLLECYDAICAQGKCDPRDQMTWLLHELEESTFAQEHVFYIDGFPDYSQQHLQIISHLIKESAHVVISVNCDQPDSALMAFEKAGQTAKELLRIAKQNGIEVNVRTIPARENPLLPLRQKVFQGRIDRTVAPEFLSVYTTDSAYSECQLAVERISALVRAGARYRDIGVVYTDPSYRNMLEMVLERSHIPAYLSGTEQILDKSVIATVLSAMDAALGGFETQDVIRYLKSNLSPVDMAMCDQIENYALLWGIRGTAWLDQWQFHPGGLGAQWDERSTALLASVNEARSKAFEPLRQLRDRFRVANTLGEQTKALYSFLADISLDVRLDGLARELDDAGDNRGAQILDQLWNILICAMEQLYDVLGNTAWDTDTFTRLFKLLLSQYDVGTIPPVLDAVTIGSADAMRCQKVDHLLILGAHEGAFPVYCSSAGILSEQDRADLRTMGVLLSGGGFEMLQSEFADIYGILCGAQKTVSVSVADGQPSFVFRRIQEISGQSFSASPTFGAALTDSLEAGAFLVRHNDRKAAIAIGLCEQFDAMSAVANHKLGEVSYENTVALYGDKLNLSASQVDKLADCRFHYFLRYGLRARELKPAAVDPAEFGTFVHAVLENTCREVMQRGGFNHVTLDETLQIARRHSDDYAKERFSQLSQERSVHLFRRNTKELELIVAELWDELHSIQFAPVGFEVSFGEGCEMPSIECSGTKLQAQLRGFVDRVDAWSADGKDYFRVVDYKTGRKDFDYCDVFNGLGLQMLLYLFALEKDNSELIGKNPVPAGVQYFPARVPLVSTLGQLDEQEAAAAREKNWKRKGLLLSQQEVLAAMESEGGAYRMPYSTRKDGTITGDLASAEQLQCLRIFVFDLLRSLVDEIASGKVEPNPYTRGSSHNACAFCPYGAVCHKENVELRRNYQAMSPQRFWEEVERKVDRHGRKAD